MDIGALLDAFRDRFHLGYLSNGWSSLASLVVVQRAKMLQSRWMVDEAGEGLIGVCTLEASILRKKAKLLKLAWTLYHLSPGPPPLLQACHSMPSIACSFLHRCQASNDVGDSGLIACDNRSTANQCCEPVTSLSASQWHSYIMLGHLSFKSWPWTNKLRHILSACDPREPFCIECSLLPQQIII